MTSRWTGAAPPHVLQRPKGARDWARVVRRLVPLIVLVFGGLLLLLAVRLVERPLHGVRRPWTPWITQFVCRNAFRLMGIGYRCHGAPLAGAGAVVANHASWLDIFALNARKRIYFVSKAEVAGWPGIGWLARATGTVFIERDPRQAAQQIALFRERLRAGHKLVFFPEGTSTDGLRVLAFKPTLFAAFHDPALAGVEVQPVTLAYHAPAGADPRFYGWYGEMGFGEHLVAVLMQRRQGHVAVHYHPPVAVREGGDRKALARRLEGQVRAALPHHRGAQIPQGQRRALVAPDLVADAEEIGVRG